MLRPEWPALGSVQYTIQKFYRVNGGSTQRKGVTPDIIMPTGNEETETGEKFEDNALPWDSIDAATYVKSGDLTAFGPELLKERFVVTGQTFVNNGSLLRVVNEE